MLLKLLADENVPLGIIKALETNGFDIARIDESDIGSSDKDVLKIATRTGRAVLTLDSDFGTMAFRDGLPAPFGIVYCRTAPMDSSLMARRIAEVLPTLDTLSNSIVVIDEKKHRLSALPES